MRERVFLKIVWTAVAASGFTVRCIPRQRFVYRAWEGGESWESPGSETSWEESGSWENKDSDWDSNDYAPSDDVLFPPLEMPDDIDSEEREMDEEADAVAEIAISELQPSMEELMEVGAIEDERLGNVASHELVDVDEDGDPVIDRDRMVFVDEATCIGCTNCACIASQTFLMDDEFGRARVFQQDGDTDETIAEAVATCPVDCIHYVPWDELVNLEKQRENVMDTYNFKGRLVGSDGLRSTNGAGAALLSISSNQAARCSNCPSNKCPDCPMFSVGDEQARVDMRSGVMRKRCGNCPTNGCVGCPLAKENPEFQKRRARREIKRKQRVKNRREEIMQKIDDASSKSVDL